MSNAPTRPSSSARELEFVLPFEGRLQSFEEAAELGFLLGGGGNGVSERGPRFGPFRFSLRREFRFGRAVLYDAELPRRPHAAADEDRQRREDAEENEHDGLVPHRFRPAALAFHVVPLICASANWNGLLDASQTSG